ncbi:MAG: hypothetical protein MJ097_05875 [Dorea sp.]|nr:hypothetical protein [Dorea sp.]
MLFFAGNEEKRNRLFHVVSAVSTLLVVLVAGYFIVRIFTGNPLTGTWASQESDLLLELKDSGKASITVTLSEENSKTIGLSYSADLEEKTITFMDAEVEVLREATVEEKESEETDDENYFWSELSPYLSTFSYSIENNELILSDMEFGDQMVLDKVK